MKPTHPSPIYITLEGEDYNLRRHGESMARADYCAPHNREQREKDLKILLEGPKEPNFQVIHQEDQISELPCNNKGLRPTT